MRIAFDPSTLVQGSNLSRSVTGVIYFDFDGFCFPDEQWSDFPVVITAWWLEALEKLERGFEREVKLYFMDGPYWMTVTRQDGDDVQIRCIEDRTGGGVVHEEMVSLQDFSKQLRRVARQVASACQRNRFESSDVDNLRRYLPN
jgi:hypothetical protein